MFTGDLRVSDSHVELDVFTEDAPAQGSHLDAFIQSLSELLGPPLEVKRVTDKGGLSGATEDPLSVSLSMFRSQRFWEAHEVLEQLWRAEEDPLKKEAVQGLILVAAAMVHHQKGRDRVCLSVLRRAAAKLGGAGSQKTPGIGGFDLKSISAQVKAMIESERVTSLCV